MRSTLALAGLATHLKTSATRSHPSAQNAKGGDAQGDVLTAESSPLSPVTAPDNILVDVHHALVLVEDVAKRPAY